MTPTAAEISEAEIGPAADALTPTEIAAVLSRTTGRDVTPVFLTTAEQEQRIG